VVDLGKVALATKVGTQGAIMLSARSHAAPGAFVVAGAARPKSRKAQCSNLDSKQIGYYQQDPDLLQKMKRPVHSLAFFLQAIRGSPAGFITNADMQIENCV
jgi:hypothetical protein